MKTIAFAVLRDDDFMASCSVFVSCFLLLCEAGLWLQGVKRWSVWGP